jgi:hypothetical protein
MTDQPRTLTTIERVIALMLSVTLRHRPDPVSLALATELYVAVLYSDAASDYYRSVYDATLFASSVLRSPHS